MTTENEKQTEEELQKKNLNAPRLNPEHIDLVIEKADFFRLSPTLTVCVLALKNGFTVRGESACASEANYDQEVGERLAAQDARSKVWPLEAYLLKERMTHGARVGRKVEEIASICHMVNRQYCRAIGDLSQLIWDEAPEWQKKSARKGVQFHLDNPEAQPAYSHTEWLKEKEATGWTYGPEKDVENKRHPCMKPFEELPEAQRAKDYIFTAIVAALR